MHKAILLIMIAAAVVSTAGCATAKHATETASSQSKPADDYQLVWADEFNIDGPLNPKDWNFEQGFVRNGEFQWYQKDNAICKDGHLIIEARREHGPNPWYNPESRTWPSSSKYIDYTSASVTTAKKHEYMYGRFEIRARIDTRPGSWPAFWTHGVSGEWPANGEIDIMEYYNNTLLANVAWAGPGGGGAGGSVWNSVCTPLDRFVPGWSNEFHIWRMDWDASSIKLFCDDLLLNSQDLSVTINRPGIPAPSNPFHQPLYIHLNQAIGGSQGGDPSRTEFPVRFEIDYVRIYQRPSQIVAATQPAMNR